MCWKIPANPFRRLSVRLVLIVTLVAVIASLVVYGLLLGSLVLDFRKQDRMELNSRLLSYWAAWQYGGNSVVLERASIDMKEHGGRPFLLLMNDSDGEMVGALIPGGWEKFDLNDLALNMLHPGTYLTLRAEKMDYSLLLTGAVMDDGSRLIVAVSTENREFLLQIYQSNYPVALIGITLAGIAVGIIAARRLLSPIRHLNEEIDRTIVTGELSRRLESPGTGDQLDQLIRRYNTLLDRVESVINSMRETLDAVAHDLRTPLTRIRGHAELALTKGSEVEYEEVLGMVVEQTDQAGALLSSLMDIAEAEQGMLHLLKTPCDLGRIAGEIAEMYELIAEEKNQTIEVWTPQTVPMHGDSVRLRQIFGNLMDNAVKYSPIGSRIGIRCFQNEEGAIVEVWDEGSGVPQTEAVRIFDRLYRGDRSRGSRGLGIGLSMVKVLTEAHGGQVSVDSSYDRGALFRVKFPKMSKT